MNNTVPVLNTSNRSVSSGYSAPFKKNLIIANVMVLAAEILVGFPANLHVCFTLYKQNNLRKVPHILLGSLSLVGALVSGIYIPLYLAINVMDQVFHKPLHGGFCVLAYSSSMLFFGLQTLTLVAMAIDRNDSVVRPLGRRITVVNVRKVVKGIWSFAGLSTAVHLILAVNADTKYCYVQTQQKTTSVIYTVALANIYLIGTVVAIFATFGRIVKKLRSSPFAESYQNSEIQVTRFSYMVLFFFIISWLPVSIFAMVNLKARLSSPEVGGLKVLLLSVSNLSHVVSPFIHKNILRAAQRGASCSEAKPKKDREKPRPVTISIKEQPELGEEGTAAAQSAASPAKSKKEDQEMARPVTISIEEQPELAGGGTVAAQITASPARSKKQDQEMARPVTISIEEHLELADSCCANGSKTNEIG